MVLAMQNPAFIHFEWLEQQQVTCLDPSPASTQLQSRALAAHARDSTAQPQQNTTTREQHTLRDLSKGAAAEPSPQVDGSVQTRAQASSAPQYILFDTLQRPGRRLLNLEKVMFRADAAGQPPGMLVLWVEREGFHRDGPGGGPSKLTFNIGAL